LQAYISKLNFARNLATCISVLGCISAYFNYNREIRMHYQHIDIRLFFFPMNNHSSTKTVKSSLIDNIPCTLPLEISESWRHLWSGCCVKTKQIFLVSIICLVLTKSCRNANINRQGAAGQISNQEIIFQDNMLKAALIYVITGRFVTSSRNWPNMLLDCIRKVL